MRLPCLLLLLACPAVAQDPWWSAPVEAALARAGEARDGWTTALHAVPEAQRAGLAFLVEHMPTRDLTGLAPDLVLENVRLAYEVRATVPWGAELPEEVFLNDVLPYANASEARDAWRPRFVEELLPLVADCATPGEAAVLLNKELFPHVEVKYSTTRRAPDQGPFESMELGVASCTGLSILLVDACRAVSVPARLTGIASWPNKRGNHTWVEVWDGGGWHFTGAAEPAPLGRAWFSGDAAQAVAGSRANGIWAVSYARTEHTFPMVWAPDVEDVFAVEVTSRYTGALEAPDPARCRVLVRVRNGGRRVVREVRCVAVDDEELAWTGQSRGERADLNDILAFEVPRGRDYALQLAVGEAWRTARTVTVADDAAQVEVDLAAESPADAELRAALEKWFAGDEKMRSGLGFTHEQRQRLVRDPAAVRALAFEAWKTAGDHGETAADVVARRVRWSGHESPYTLKEVGERPAGGWPLVIAMHGGGGVPKHVNDGGWKTMQSYYRDHPEVGGYKYLALRAPNDNWNGFYDDTISGLLTQLIRDMVVHEEVDPDRVTAIGYSHGGYGAFVIGPKIPYRFAAVHASAAAPTDGETAAVNLRNLHFTFMCGEKDAAYGRIERCRAFAEELAALRGERTDVFSGGFSEQAGYGHGGLPDRDLTTELVPRVRNAAPRELTWQPTDGLLQDFYWLRVEEPEGSVSASVLDNVVTVEVEGPVTVYLDERLIDFSKPVTIGRGEDRRAVEMAPGLETLCASLAQRGDPGLAFTVRVDL